MLIPVTADVMAPHRLICRGYGNANMLSARPNADPAEMPRIADPGNLQEVRRADCPGPGPASS